MRLLAHLSDLHFGTAAPRVIEALREALLRVAPDLVVVSGDLTQRARTHQFLEARRFLASLPFPLLTAPGNHDMPLYNLLARAGWPLARYRRHIHPDPAPFFMDEEMAVLALNSAGRLAWRRGRLKPKHLEVILRRFHEAGEGRLKVLVMHHPLPRLINCQLPLPASAAPDVILSGHGHASLAEASRAWLGGVEGCALAIHAGTALSNRVRAEANAFNLVRLDRDQAEVSVSVRMWDGRGFVEQRQVAFRRQQDIWMRQLASGSEA